MNKRICENISAFHPGYYISDIIDEMEITQLEFAKRLNITPKNLSDLINGKASISNNIAKNLSLMLGTSVDVWLNLQKTYDEKVIEIEKLEAERKEQEVFKIIDYTFFEKLGLVKATRNQQEKVIELLRCLKIATFDVLKKHDFLVQFRQGAEDYHNEKQIVNANAWVQTAINIGNEIETEKFDEKKLKFFLSEMRQMAKMNTLDFLPRLKKKLSECGVALVVIPSLKNSNVYGAIKWINHDKVILGITNRGIVSDKFWFSFFHEIGHILQKKIKNIFITSDHENCEDEMEKDADEFARNVLIPPDKLYDFVSVNNFSKKSVELFAEKIDTHPGIVVGRLQKEGYIPFANLNGLKVKYTKLRNC
ncbi:MAG: HigA family addiction module antitoxin [Clostridia bacterium]|nr:HigA family addiction module antitoxin [Clostridia bacterium]MDD4048930.1 HigA family addiction module antitoxin [Clostridia bacterium]